MVPFRLSLSVGEGHICSIEINKCKNDKIRVLNNFINYCLEIKVKYQEFPHPCLFTNGNSHWKLQKQFHRLSQRFFVLPDGTDHVAVDIVAWTGEGRRIKITLQGSEQVSNQFKGTDPISNHIIFHTGTIF